MKQADHTGRLGNCDDLEAADNQSVGHGAAENAFPHDCPTGRRPVNATVLSLKVRDSMPFPVDAKWITQTEQTLGVRFPASFVTAMSKMNGGSVRTRIDDFELFPFLDASDRKRIQRTCSSIDRETNTARKEWPGFPPNTVAIGANGGGDLLILIPMPDHPDTLQHSVYWWDHETGEVDQVADDFSELPKT